MGRTDFSTIIPSLAPEAEDVALDRLLSPSRHYKHPDDVVGDLELDMGEKRAILSSWASDARAVESIPTLRGPPGMRHTVSFNAIMDALHRLDQPVDAGAMTSTAMQRVGRQHFDA